jgi:hypothetical protein
MLTFDLIQLCQLQGASFVKISERCFEAAIAKRPHISADLALRDPQRFANLGLRLTLQVAFRDAL